MKDGGFLLEDARFFLALSMFLGRFCFFLGTSLERKLMEEHIASETCCNLREYSHSNGKVSFCQ